MARNRKRNAGRRRGGILGAAAFAARRVLAYFACELGTYENLAGMGHLDGSSFDLIEDSTWLKSLPVREDFDKGIYRHYRLFTYDDVYNIIAVSYEFAAEL